MRNKDKKNKIKYPSCIGNFGKHHSFCEEECEYNVVCEECSKYRDE